MQNTYTIQTVKKAKLLRACGRVVTSAVITYPQIIPLLPDTSPADGVQRFNQTYEAVADEFFSQGLTIPTQQGEALLAAVSEKECYAFARWEISCDVSARWTSEDSRRYKGELLAVTIVTTAQKRFQPHTKKSIQLCQRWMMPQGYILE